MSANLKTEIRRILADQREEERTDSVSKATLEVVLAGPDREPGDVERALAELVEEGEANQDGNRYKLASGKS